MEIQASRAMPTITCPTPAHAGLGDGNLSNTGFHDVNPSAPAIPDANLPGPSVFGAKPSDRFDACAKSRGPK